MANNKTSLKIVDNVHSAKLNGPGYVGLGEDFMSLSPAQYDDFVKDKHGYSFEFINTPQVTQKDRLVTWKDDNDDVHPIVSGDNKIKVEADNPNDGGKPKTVISVPSEPVGNLDYLGEYVTYIQGATMDDAKNFLLGMMLITRCR